MSSNGAIANGIAFILGGEQKVSQGGFHRCSSSAISQTLEACSAMNGQIPSLHLLLPNTIFLRDQANAALLRLIEAAQGPNHWWQEAPVAVGDVAMVESNKTDVTNDAKASQNVPASPNLNGEQGVVIATPRSSAIGLCAPPF